MRNPLCVALSLTASEETTHYTTPSPGDRLLRRAAREEEDSLLALCP